MRDTAGPYKLLERTGEDRLGELWRARDTARGRTALVRLVDPQIAADATQRAALIAAARKAATLSHPSIAALFDVIEDADGIALAHEHVEGRTLASTLGGTPLNPRMAVAIAIQIADGLAELHAADVLHGSVDAAQVVITQRGQAKLLNAGLMPWLTPGARPRDDLAALGELLSAMVGPNLPPDPWASDLRHAIDRTQPGHPRRYEAVATFAAALRSVSAALEARAEAQPVATAGSGKAAMLWSALALLLLVLGAWFLLQ